MFVAIQFHQCFAHLTFVLSVANQNNVLANLGVHINIQSSKKFLLENGCGLLRRQRNEMCILP